MQSLLLIFLYLGDFEYGHHVAHVRLEHSEYGMVAVLPEIVGLHCHALVPIPFVDLALTESRQSGDLRNLFLAPLVTLLELILQYIHLHRILL